MKKTTWMVLILAALWGGLWPATAAAEEARKPKGKMVFVAMTGVEDLNVLESSLRHATVAAKSGRLEEVVWLSYGRAVVALDPTVKAVPPSVRKAASDAQAAGVKLVACASALDKWGIDPKTLTPKAQVVKNAIDELARLVGEGYQIIRY